MDRRLFVAAIAVVMGAGTAVRAEPVTDNATSGLSEEGHGYHDLPFGASLDADRSDATHQRGTSSHASLGDAATANVGNVDTRGFVTGPAVLGQFMSTDSVAYVDFAFGVNPRDGGMELPLYPVRIHTMGEVSVTSQGMAYGGASAMVSIVDVLTHGVGLQGVGNASDAFDQVETLWLAPGTYHGRVQVGGWGSASCTMPDSAGPCVPSSVSYQALADPTFTFDQAAWDEAHPDTPLTLGERFRIDFNPNIPMDPAALVALAPVPEPSVLVSLGLGLAAIGIVRSRRLRQAG